MSPPSPHEAFVLFVSPTQIPKAQSWLPFGPIPMRCVWEEGAMQR